MIMELNTKYLGRGEEGHSSYWKSKCRHMELCTSVVCLGISKPLHVAGIRGMHEQQEATLRRLVGENHECLVCPI